MNRDTVKTTSFLQRINDYFEIDANINALSASADGKVYAACDNGLCLIDGDNVKTIRKESGFSGVYCCECGRVFASAENTVYEVTENGLKTVGEFDENVVSIGGRDGFFALTERVLYRFDDEKFQVLKETEQPDSLFAIRGDRVVAANKNSIQRLEGKRRSWRCIFPDHSTMPRIAANAMDFDSLGYLWIGADEGLYLYDYKNGWYCRDQIKCLPSEKIYDVKVCDNGAIFVGTDAGAVLIKDGASKYLPATRYAFDSDVTAVAYANGVYYTGSKGGIVKISEKDMTLEEKADWFFDTTEKYYPRKDGFVTWLGGIKGNDLSTAGVSEISDNDGLWTQMYITSLSYKYAVTKDKKALEAARRSMKAMLLLTKAPEIKGFTARAVRYPDEPSFGKGLEEQAEGAEWHRSSDGTYEWLGETSSDEMTGHFNGFSIYYDLCANKAEKKEICEAVCNIVDHILDNGGYLVDWDGKPTTWACWNPDDLNNDNMWMWERGINSLEMLAFLKVAYHVSGKEKYNEKYLELIKTHHFLINASFHKRADGHSCHIDDNLGMLNTITILRLEEDPAIRNLLLMGLEGHWQYERVEENPFYSFVYTAFTGRPSDVDFSIKTLKDFPLETLSRKMLNSKRRSNEYDEESLYWGEDARIKHPFAWDEKPFSKFDGNPFGVDGGGRGRAESGMTFMIIYWFGRYYGIIE